MYFEKYTVLWSELFISKPTECLPHSAVTSFGHEAALLKIIFKCGIILSSIFPTHLSHSPEGLHSFCQNDCKNIQVFLDRLDSAPYVLVIQQRVTASMKTPETDVDYKRLTTTTIIFCKSAIIINLWLSYSPVLDINMSESHKVDIQHRLPVCSCWADRWSFGYI